MKYFSQIENILTQLLKKTEKEKETPDLRSHFRSILLRIQEHDRRKTFLTPSLFFFKKINLKISGGFVIAAFFGFFVFYGFDSHQSVNELNSGIDQYVSEISDTSDAHSESIKTLNDISFVDDDYSINIIYSRN